MNKRFRWQYDEEKKVWVEQSGIFCVKPIENFSGKFKIEYYNVRKMINKYKSPNNRPWNFFSDMSFSSEDSAKQCFERVYTQAHLIYKHNMKE